MARFDRVCSSAASRSAKAIGITRFFLKSYKTTRTKLGVLL